MVWPKDFTPFLEEERRILLQVENARPVWEFPTEPSIWQEFDWDADPILRNRSTSVVYVFREVGGDPEQTFQDFFDFKGDQKGRPDARKLPKENAPCDVLYVGSCRKGFPNRLRQHLGEGPRGTYALNLRHWFKGRFQLLVRQYVVNGRVLQGIEDAVASSLDPAFGKKGGNGR